MLTQMPNKQLTTVYQPVDQISAFNKSNKKSLPPYPPLTDRMQVSSTSIASCQTNCPSDLYTSCFREVNYITSPSLPQIDLRLICVQHIEPVNERVAEFLPPSQSTTTVNTRMHYSPCMCRMDYELYSTVRISTVLLQYVWEEYSSTFSFTFLSKLSDCVEF